MGPLWLLSPENAIIIGINLWEGIILWPVVAWNLYAVTMKLCQGQVWKQGKEFIRIVRLERLEVEYKSQLSLVNKTGTLNVTSKKDFCRLLKGAKLLALKPTTQEDGGREPNPLN